MQYFIPSQTTQNTVKKQPPKVSSVDCVTAVLLVLIIDACLEFCCASFFKFQIIHGGFFPPTCAPVGWPPQSLKESHNIWIATYHTQARKKLNLHRWMLRWSAHFAFQSHYIAVLHCSSPTQRGGNSGGPCNCVHEQHFRNESWVIILFQWLSSPQWTYEIRSKYM